MRVHPNSLFLYLFTIYYFLIYDSIVSRKKTTKQLVRERPTPEELATLPRTAITVVVDNVRSLDNVGMIFRLCELVRVDHLYLAGYTGYPEEPGDTRPRTVIDRHNHRITKTAVYAVPHQPWMHIEDPVPLVAELKKQGQKVIVLEQTDTSVAYNKLPITNYQLPITLVIGHERMGVRQELVDLADTLVEIPILGLGNSHNVATACGILLYKVLEINRLIG